MELAARSFDLFSSLINASQPSSALARFTQELLKWIGRECVDEHWLIKCAELAGGLAYPNSDGLMIRDAIAEADKQLRSLRAPLRLINSGSLGR
jgi:hypothetical protein